MQRIKMNIYSWNVNGLRAVLNKGKLQEFISKENPDILCLQEIKCQASQCNFNFEKIGYKILMNPAEKPGYSGTAILIKNKFVDTIKITNKTPDSESDFSKVAKKEGRIQILDCNTFYLINVYVPNSKPTLERLAFRYTEWDKNFREFLKELEKEKPIITCGDFNAAHEEIDLARPKTNHHSAGFTNEEREGIAKLLNMGFVDTFRKKNPDIARYTWWSHWGHARENNVGWRIDYFFISKSIEKNLKNAEIYEKYTGSDHCPISVEMEF